MVQRLKCMDRRNIDQVSINWQNPMVGFISMWMRLFFYLTFIKLKPFNWHGLKIDYFVVFIFSCTKERKKEFSHNILFDVSIISNWPITVGINWISCEIALNKKKRYQQNEVTTPKLLNKSSDKITMRCQPIEFISKMFVPI